MYLAGILHKYPLKKTMQQFKVLTITLLNKLNVLQWDNHLYSP